MGYTKNRTYLRSFTRAVHASLTVNPGAFSSARKKLNLGIGGDAISRCLEGLTALFSLFLVDILSRSKFYPLIISMQIWTYYESHIFK